MCGMHTPAGHTRVIYTFGNNEDTSFEHAMREIDLSAEIHAFDDRPDPLSKILTGALFRFHPYALADQTEGRKMTLSDMATQLGHTMIDILEMDLTHGAEYKAVPQFLKKSSGSPHVQQVSMVGQLSGSLMCCVIRY